MKALTTAIFHVLAKVGELFVPPIPQAYHEIWQPTRELMELPPMEIQTTGGIRLPLNTGKPWYGPAGSLVAVSRGASYHRHRDTGVLVMPVVQTTAPIQRLAPRHTPIPETPAEIVVPAPDLSAAIARVDSARLSWLYDDPPILAPLSEQSLSVADRTAVSRTTDKPDSALVELAAMAARFDPDRTEMAIPAVISQQARKLQRWLRESE